ncbi:unnamed protein product [Scytosiphon promiscuus]
MSSATVAAQRSPDAATSPGYQKGTPDGASAAPNQTTERPASAELESQAAPSSEPPKPNEPAKPSSSAAVEAAGGPDAGGAKASEGGGGDATTKEGEEAGEGEATGAAAPSENNLIINYLPSHVTEIELRNMFAVHGDLAHVKVVYDRSTGKSMGYGFVKFTTNEAAAAATTAINGMAIDRKRIKVSVARPSSKDIKNSKLYVTNLPDHFSQDQVVEVFEQCRTLVDPKTTISRCTAFVQFDTRREAKDALKFMNGHVLPGAKKGLLVKFAEDHHRRVQRQEQGQHVKGGRGMDNNQGGGGHYGNHNQQQQASHVWRGPRSGMSSTGGNFAGSACAMPSRVCGAAHSMGPRHGHMNHGFMNNMGMQAPPPDGSPLGQQGMMGRYGMQQQQQVPGGYNMMHLNNAMGMMNVGAPGSATGPPPGAPGGRADGSAGGAVVDGGVGGAATFGMGGGGGARSMMRGDQQQQHGVPPAGIPQQMLSPSGAYGGPGGPGMAPYVGDMKGANLGGGGGSMAQVKHQQQQQQQQQVGGDRGDQLQQKQQQQQPPFALRSV